MIGEWIRFGLCTFCVLGGLFAVFTAILGLFRFDFAQLGRAYPPLCCAEKD